MCSADSDSRPGKVPWAGTRRVASVTVVLEPVQGGPLGFKI
jgi:hypothetical protein